MTPNAARVTCPSATGVASYKSRVGRHLHQGHFNRLKCYLKSKRLLPTADRGGSVVVESFLDRYENVQGVQVSMRIRGTQDGNPLVNVTLLEVKFADKFDAQTFAKP